ncbi:MAG: glutamine-hydrolyzing carbamoyl-phosphate synthase small subunit [Dehalococcoidia bacterium]|nr:glutamine-hydrolyzing carbamoyl-phosphate synthase small subunit [Dehalococcoidia bacterium]
MPPKAILALEDGAVFEGDAIGAPTTAVGEVVFNTSMIGYQEMLTDPSYAGQIVVPTYPMIGNYGINQQDVESRRIQVRGFVVREACDEPSHWGSQSTLHDYLASQGVPGVAGLDTRAITRRLRSKGVMMGVLTSEMSPEAALEHLRRQPSYGTLDFVREVSVSKSYVWPPEDPSAKYRVAVLDLGVKYNILRILKAKGCNVVAVPCTASADEVLATKPDGIVISPGPGDPALLEYLVATTKKLMGRAPIFGICLGHQVLGHAYGGRTFKLKFGHRGGNHPVKDRVTGRVHITAQNHGYAVDGDSLPSDVEVTHVNLNDGTVEGMRHKGLPIMSIQYHSEASPGPMDNVYMFDRFLEMVEAHKK